MNPTLTRYHLLSPFPRAGFQQPAHLYLRGYDKIMAFKNLFARIRRFLHIYTEDEHREILTELRASYEERLKAVKAELSEVSDNLDASQHEVKILKDTVEPIRSIASRAKKIEEENEKLREAIDTDNKLLKEIRRCLSYELHESTDFNFPRSTCIPGSALIRDYHASTDDGDKYSIVRSRIVCTDAETSEINRLAGESEKTLYLLRIMGERGITSRIGERLISSGAVTLIQAYNDNCTSYEFYTEVAAVIPKVQYVIDPQSSAVIIE